MLPWRASKTRPRQAENLGEVRSLASLPLWFGGLLFIAPVVCFSVFGALLADRFIPQQVLAADNNIAGFICRRLLSSSDPRRAETIYGNGYSS